MLELSNKSGAEFLAAFKDEIDEELIKVYDQAIDKYLINMNQHVIDADQPDSIKALKKNCFLFVFA